jgi:hypothetical protein
MSLEKAGRRGPQPTTRDAARCVGAAVLSLLLACGCIETGTVRYRFAVPQGQGQLAESRVVPGNYDGYAVIGPCKPIAWTEVRLGIRGRGSRRIVHGSVEGWEDAMLALRSRAEEALGSLAQAVWYEDSPCHPGEPALTAFVATYGEIDVAAERLGRLLRDEDLGDYADVVLLDPDPNGRPTVEHNWRMPLARRRFYPYEFAVTAGPRYRGSWDTVVALHLGVISGREEEPPSKAGWFWGFGLDGRLSLNSADPRWSVGPSLRLGRAFGSLEPDRPAPVTNRGTYVYGQAGLEWSTGGPLVVTSLGMTTLALAEFILTRYNRTGNALYPLLLPLALIDHVEVASTFAVRGGTPSTVAILFGFSL